MTSEPVPAPFRPSIKTQADLERMWRRLMKPLGFSGCSLWMVVVEGDRPVPQMMELTELPDTPDPEDIEAIATFLAHLASPGARYAFLRSRPGGGRASAGDRAWAAALYGAARRSGAELDVVHLAHDHDVLPLPMDEVVVESA